MHIVSWQSILIIPWIFLSFFLANVIWGNLPNFIKQFIIFQPMRFGFFKMRPHTFSKIATISKFCSTTFRTSNTVTMPKPVLQISWQSISLNWKYLGSLRRGRGRYFGSTICTALVNASPTSPWLGSVGSARWICILCANLIVLGIVVLQLGSGQAILSAVVIAGRRLFPDLKSGKCSLVTSSNWDPSRWWTCSRCCFIFLGSARDRSALRATIGFLHSGQFFVRGRPGDAGGLCADAFVSLLVCLSLCY